MSRRIFTSVAIRWLLAGIAFAIASWFWVLNAFAEPPNVATLTPDQAAYVLRLRDAELERARDICFQHSEPTGTTLMCFNNPMCNRTYKWPECWDLDKTWAESGAAARAEVRRQVQEMEDHVFVLQQSRK